MKKYIINNRQALLSVTLLSTLMFSSCIDEFNADLPSPENNTIVVEGEIISDCDCSFYISHASSLDSKEKIYADVIDIKVFGSDGQIFQGFRVEDSPQSIVPVGHLDPQYEYHLEILIGDMSSENGFFKIWSDPLKPVQNVGVSDVTFNEARDGNDVDILVSTEASEECKYFKWTYVEDWEVNAPFIVYVWYNPELKRIEQWEDRKPRGWKHATSDAILLGNTENLENNKINKHRIYQIARGDDRFNTLYRTLVQQHSISKEQYDYEVARMEMSGDMGGLFTPQPSELPTNIHAEKDLRLLGYVGVSSALSTFELYIDKNELSPYSPEMPGIYKDITDTNDADMSEYLYRSGYQVLSYDPHLSQARWVERWGVDVTAYPTKAKLVRPDNWPLD